MKTEDAEVLRRQRAKPSKIKARYSQPTCKNYSFSKQYYLHEQELVLLSRNLSSISMCLIAQITGPLI